jgi:hypothetical protein
MRLINKHITKIQITTNDLSITNTKGDLYAIRSFKSTVAQNGESTSQVDTICADRSLSKNDRLQTNNISHSWDKQLVPFTGSKISKRRNTMKHPEVLPGGRNAQKSINNNKSNNQISKRSNVMNATTVISRGIITLLSLLLFVGVTFGQNLVLGGSTTTYGGTWNVKGNIDNTAMAAGVAFTGTVNLKGTTTQAIGVASKPNIDFGTLKATGVSTKTFNVASDITTNIDASTGTSTQFAVAGGNKLTLQGTITNTGTATTPYDFTASGAEVDYHGAAQTVLATPYDKLTVSAGGGDKTLGGNLTVASALSVSTGNLAIGANTLTVNGTYTVAGTVTGGATSNITLNGSGDLAAFTVTNGLNDLVLNRSGNTVTLSSGLAINHVLTLTAGTLAVSTQTLTLNGTGAVISVTAGALSSSATGTVDYHANAQNVIAATYGNLTFTAGIKTLASSGTIGISGTLTDDGAAHVVTGSTVDFNGAAQNIPAFSFNNLLTHGAGTTKTAQGNIGIAGTFDNGGAGNDAVTLLMAGYTLTGTISDNTASTIKFAGATNGRAVTTGTVEYNGDDATLQTITAGTYATLVLSRSSGTNPAPKQIAGDATVHTTLDMTIPATTSLTLLAGTGSTALNVDGNLYVNGAVTNNGTITVGL